jgi:hypothetical protein
MTPEEILEVDAKRNHPPGTVAGHLMADINDELRKGGSIVRQGNVLIVFRALKPGVIEHHSFSADTPQNLRAANIALWKMLKKAGAKTAQTSYENPKINELLKSAMGEFNIKITKAGDRYTAKVTL